MPNRKIRYLKTGTGENFSVTISREAAAVFSGCHLQENILDDGIFLSLQGRKVVDIPRFSRYRGSYEEKRGRKKKDEKEDTIIV